MRKVNTDNLFYGEVLADRSVGINILTKGMTENGESSNDHKEEHTHTAILQITNWRFLLTILGGGISSHKYYWDFPWSDIIQVSSSTTCVTITLNDQSSIAIIHEDASIASIKLWALGEAIKTEGQNHGNPWDRSSSINLTCETIIPYTGEWARILRLYGISCRKGEKPKRLDWNDTLSIDAVNRAFAKKNLERHGDEHDIHAKSTWSDGKQKNIIGVVSKSPRLADGEHIHRICVAEDGSSNSLEEEHECTYHTIGRKVRSFCTTTQSDNDRTDFAFRRVNGLLVDLLGDDRGSLIVLRECLSLIQSLESSKTPRIFSIWNLVLQERLAPVFGERSLQIAQSFLRGYLGE